MRLMRTSLHRGNPHSVLSCCLHTCFVCGSPAFACSVASLSQCAAYYWPGLLSLHRETLAQPQACKRQLISTVCKTYATENALLSSHFPQEGEKVLDLLQAFAQTSRFIRPPPGSVQVTCNSECTSRSRGAQIALSRPSASSSRPQAPGLRP